MGIRRFFGRKSEDRDLAQEMEAHLAHQVDDNLARGMSAEEARRQAYLRLGNPQRLREQVWRQNSLVFLESLWQDLRYAVRRLRVHPAFTTVGVLTLALGVGATTAIFSAVNPILFASLPYPQAGRIMAIWETAKERPRINGTFGMYQGLRDRSRYFETMAVFKPWQPTLTGDYEPERLEGQRVSSSYFKVLGIAPFMGNDFQASDDRPNGPNVALLSESLWQRRFAGDPKIIGKQITLSGQLYLVIGIMPRDFENVLAPKAKLWSLLQYDLSLGPAWGHHLETVGRLKPGVNPAQAVQELNAIGREVLTEQHPQTYPREVRFLVSSLQSDVTSGVKPALLAVFGAVFLVLIIACVNIANLLLGRSVQRQSEFAMRAALGAPGGRLLRQVLTENLVLAMAGGVVGVGFAMLAIRLLVSISPANFPRAGSIGMDRTVLAFGLGITTLAGLAFGLMPALQAAWSEPRKDLGARSREVTGGRSPIRSVLVIGEVAVALVLLIGSGLLLRSLEHLFAVDAGFDAANVLTMQIQTAGRKYEENAAVHRFFNNVLASALGVPGARAAALTSQVPLGGELDEYGARFEANTTQPAQTYSVYRYAVTPGYIATMGIPLKSGREFNQRDIAGAPLVALISESLARGRFSQKDPIGQTLQLGPQGPFTIVGVVGDVKQLSLAMNQADAVYIPMEQWQFADNAMSLMVRTRSNAADLAPAIRSAVWSVDKNQAIVRATTMEQLVTESEAERHFVFLLFEFFALTALVLAAVGIYGVLAGSVSERTREIGIRSALGASKGIVLRMVIRQGLSLTAIGVALGLVAAIFASQLLITLLFGVSRFDVVTYVGVVALLGGVSLIACWLPAWRAAGVDPAIALKAE
ncbi:MAG TPA: ABC transporter permease [Candidatus Angelobacter sp.]|nr:ABC transporter permease [Candidatus Angelobacter sp.]